MNKQNLNKAQVAQKAGLSRASLTQWFKRGKNSGWVNVETKTLNTLAKALNREPEVFLSERIALDQFQSRFLWDHLYPSMEGFVKALAQNRLPAYARLVQILGFHKSSVILGKKAVKRFPSYAKFIHPARRKQLEILKPLYE